MRPDDTRGVSRRQVLATAAAATAGLVAAPFLNLGRFKLFARSATEYSARCIELMQRAVVIDMLSPLTIDDRWVAWAKNPEKFDAATYQKYKDSGINVFHHSFGSGGPDAYNQGINYFGAVNALIAGADQYLMRIDSANDFKTLKGSGKVGVMLGLQNSEHFRRPNDVQTFWDIGQRVSQLTYNARNMIGNGSTERHDEGISDFGAAIIESMNKVGMVVDVSHCGDRTTLDAFEISKKPVLITHTNCRTLAPGHPRCKTDEAIKAAGKAGGVVGITGVRMFVKTTEPTTIEDVLNHFDLVKKLIGSEHLGVGSDMDLDGYDDLTPEMNKALRASYKGSYGFREKIDIEGLDHPKRMFDLTDGLIRRKYSDAEIIGVLGGNFARVLGEIWGGQAS